MASPSKVEARPETVETAEKSLYDRDFYSWAMSQAALIRERRFDEIDIENVAEEIETLGRSEASALKSTFRILLMHLLKWQYQPALRSKSWRNTIGRERTNFEEILDDNPGLKPRRQELFAKAYRVARKDAARETDLPLDTFPPQSPYSLEQALDETFLPD
ncbi:MAG: DUF29 domain-containing protein [Geminicoccaceae bacterium]